jgi:ABC-type glycerol-3-phosphate transport system substrate-binding protein
MATQVSQVNAGGGYIPKGATNVVVAKDLMKYWMQPEVTNDNMKAALGRWVPANTQVVKDDPFWLHNQDPHVIPYVKENKGPTIPFFEGVHASLESGEFRTTFGNGPCRCHQERHEGV